MAEQTPPQQLDDDGTMPFVEHLRELRLRLRNAVIALIVGFGAAYGFSEELARLMLQPFERSWQALQGTNEVFAGPPAVYFKSIIEPFWTYFSLSLWAGVFIASPFIFYQIWRFVSPGLYRQERRVGLVFALMSAICFTGGAVFCFMVVLEPVYQYLLGFATDNLAKLSGGMLSQPAAGQLPLKPLLTIQEYMAFARRLLLAFGLVFELPLLIFFLSLIGVVTHRSLWRFNRWWTVLAFVISALLTPPDLFSQVVMAGPLIVLYNFSILIAYFVTKRREAREAELSSSQALVPTEREPGAGGDD
ncbi:twin-arginine translocase subunit TatC [Haliangium sp.]|uniref:twin-arginine translocase subunit TatC n=1 Tax=Haliangium sp. TaxID=2663208 RepID=UPI003D14B3AA